MLEINRLWFTKYKDRRPFDLAELIADGIPSPAELKNSVTMKSAEFKETVLLEG